MAGMIEKNMGQAPAMPPEAMPPQGPEADPDSDPAYGAAMEFAMQALYKNGAAKDIAAALTGARDLVEGLANTAYEIVSIVDEKTDGAVPDELFALLATNILEEVAEIGAAAGIEMTPNDLAGSLKQMILRYIGEQGGDTTQLQAAMDQVDPAEFERIGAEDAPAAEGMPA